MVAAAGFSGHGILSQKRAQFAGAGGVLGLVSNMHVLAIAVFASLGGFVYGCKYLQHFETVRFAEKVFQTIKECSAKF